MLYPVRILDSDGNIKKTLTSDEMRALYWKHFEEEEELRSTLTYQKKKISHRIKQMLDAQYAEINDLSYVNN